MLLSKIQYLNVQNPCLPRIVDMRNREVKVILLFPKGVREIEDRRTVMQKFLLRTQCKFFGQYCVLSKLSRDVHFFISKIKLNKIRMTVSHTPTKEFT